MVASTSIPDWLAAGVRVYDVYARSPDAEFILGSDFEDEEALRVADLEWRECQIPIEAFEVSATSLESHVAGLLGAGASAAARKAEAARCNGVGEWIKGCGGVDLALQKSPMLVTLRDGRIKMEDGYHRLGVAVFEFGALQVRAICAEVDGQANRAQEVFRSTPG